MGTTLTALKAGNVAIQRVLAIEGFPHLITNGATARAVTAWAGTGYTQAIKGLFVDGRTEQMLDWRTPIRPVGILTFHVHPGRRDSATYDLLGKAVHKRDAGYESRLTQSFKPGDTTLNVVSTTGSPAAPGEIFVGTSCIAYTGKTGTTFTGCARKYVPFGTLGDDTTFGRHHRVSSFDFHARLQPVVSECRREWVGAWVGLYVHRRVGDVLDVKAQAQRVFAGRIVAVRYDSRTGMMVIEAEHVCNYLAEASLLEDQWVGRVREGIYLWAGMSFDAEDHNGATAKTANPLTVVAAGAAGTNQINAGWFTLAELVSALNAWLQGEKIANRLHGTYTFSAPEQSDQGPRTRILFRIDGTTPDWGHFWIDLRPPVAHFLGFTANQNSGSVVEGHAPADEARSVFSSYEPFRTLLRSNDNGTGAGTIVVEMETTSGTFAAQTSLLPQEAADLATEASGDWGLFAIDGFIVIGRAVSSTKLDYVRPVLSLNEGWSTNVLTQFFDVSYGRRITDTNDLEVRQIFVLEGAPKSIITAVFCSTGVTDYNDDGHGYDILPSTIALGIPYGILSEPGGSADTFADSVAALPESGDVIRVWIDKPKKVREVFSGDLIIRGGHLIWRNQVLRFVSRQSPNADHAVHTLTEANKARPLDTVEQNPSDMIETDEGIANVIVFRYSRDFARDHFNGRRICEDPASIASKGARKFEVQLPNIHGDTVEDLIGGFMATMTQVSRPFWKLDRSIDFRLFEDCAPGDIAVVTDDLAYNVSTGLHGITARPALIYKHAVDWGGPMPGAKSDAKALPAIGEIMLAFQDVDRVVPFSPAAMVDETANAGGFTAGYNAGTVTLRTKAHRYSHTSDPVDAVPFQTNGRKLLILELDPAGGVSDSWTRDSAGGTGDDVILSAALAAPAFNANKRYVIVPQSYSAADTVQRSKAFQADDADIQVQDLRVAFRYGSALNPFSKLVVHTDLPERYSSSSHGDGVALDVAHEHGLALMLNNLIDHRTAPNSPFLENAIRSVPALAPFGATDWYLAYRRRIWVGPHQMLSGQTRKLQVGPWARSSSGAACKVRVTLSRFSPQENPLYTPNENVLHSSPMSQAEWAGITSTTWGELAAADLDLRVADAGGYAWLSLEIMGVAQTRGCSRLRAKARNE